MKRSVYLFVGLVTLFVCGVPASPQQLPPEAMEHMDRGRAAMDRSQYHEAIAEFRRVLKMSNTCAECCMHLVRAYQQLGAHKDALEMARKVLEIVHDDRSRAIAHNLIGVETSVLEIGRASCRERV